MRSRLLHDELQACTFAACSEARVPCMSYTTACQAQPQQDLSGLPLTTAATLQALGSEQQSTFLISPAFVLRSLSLASR